MAEIIKLSINSINGETIQTCSARDLHAFLEVSFQRLGQEPY